MLIRSKGRSDGLSSRKRKDSSFDDHGSDYATDVGEVTSKKHKPVRLHNIFPTKRLFLTFNRIKCLFVLYGGVFSCNAIVERASTQKLCKVTWIVHCLIWKSALHDL